LTVFTKAFSNEKRNKKVKTLTSKKLADYAKRIKELEALVGRKQIKLEYLEKLIEIAEDSLGVDIKKNLNTPHLDTSQQTETK